MRWGLLRLGKVPGLWWGSLAAGATAMIKRYGKEAREGKPPASVGRTSC